MIPLFKVAMNRKALYAVCKTLDSGYIGEGPRVSEFERAFGAWLGTPDWPIPLVAVNSGTSAIALALHLIGIGPGDEVVTTPMTCMATNVHLAHRGATIIWADVLSSSGLIDPADVAAKITPRTKAIIAVNWGGLQADYWQLTRFGLPVIEDDAHLSLPGGVIGTYSCFSFQAIKHLTCGDGGALRCPPEQYERARRLRWYGLDRDVPTDFRADQRVAEAGYKFHMNDIAASIGLANLADLDTRLADTHDNAAYYDAALTGVPSITTPPSSKLHSYWLYTLLVDDRPTFIDFLRERGIEASPVHARNDWHPCFQAVAPPQHLPGLDYFAAHEVAVPVGWWLTHADREHVVKTVWDYTEAR